MLLIAKEVTQMDYKHLIETDPVTDEAYYKFEQISEYLQLNYNEFAFQSEIINTQLENYLTTQGLSPKDAILVADMMIKEIWEKTRLQKLEDQEAWIKELVNISRWRKWLDKINDSHRRGEANPDMFSLLVMFMAKCFYHSMAKEETLRKEFESRSSLPSNTTNILSNMAGDNLPTDKPK